ncbi:MFS transporter [Amycolatopsis sp. lyj-346]|uniref:MFS transporter n=1 Tax=Amycolatopsis sp. lyj-346 TaxID=2789289 RepID=UPI00397E1FC5
MVAAFSTSAGMLIVARGALGIAGATLAPSTLSLIGTMFADPRQRAEAIGIWAGCFTVGAIVGPVVGGFMLEHFWWGSVFLLGVPAMVLLLFSMLGGTTMLFVAQFFQLAQHLSPVGAALGLLPGMAASTVSFLAAPVLARRVRPGRLIAGGVALAASGMAVLAFVEPAAGPGWPALGFAVTSLGVGPMVALGTDLVVGSVPVRKAGAAASLAQTVNEFGYAFGLATVGTLGNAVVRSHGLPDGLHVVAGLAAVAFAVLVFFVARHLRSVRTLAA